MKDETIHINKVTDLVDWQEEEDAPGDEDTADLIHRVIFWRTFLCFYTNVEKICIFMPGICKCKPTR